MSNFAKKRKIFDTAVDRVAKNAETLDSVVEKSLKEIMQTTLKQGVDEAELAPEFIIPFDSYVKELSQRKPLFTCYAKCKNPKKLFTCGFCNECEWFCDNCGMTLTKLPCTSSVEYICKQCKLAKQDDKNFWYCPYIGCPKCTGTTAEHQQYAEKLRTLDKNYQELTTVLQNKRKISQVEAFLNSPSSPLDPNLVVKLQRSLGFVADGPEKKTTTSQAK